MKLRKGREYLKEDIGGKWTHIFSRLLLKFKKIEHIFVKLNSI